MTEQREAAPTVGFMDEYCQNYRLLFAAIRSFEAFKFLPVGLLSAIPRKSLPAIASPDQNTTKLIEKIQACLQEGSCLGWLIDPGGKVVMIFWPDRPLAFLKGASQLPIIEDIALTLTVENLFSWL